MIIITVIRFCHFF